jgi:hypothetical protein
MKEDPPKRARWPRYRGNFRLPLTALLAIMFGSKIVAVSPPCIGRSLEASFAVVRSVVIYDLLILISEREIAPLRAEAPRKMRVN